MLTSKLNGLFYFGFFFSLNNTFSWGRSGGGGKAKQYLVFPDGIKHILTYQCTNSLYQLLKIISYTESKTQVYGTLFNIFSDV